MQRHLHQRRGLTLPEVAGVAVIITILVALFFPIVCGARPAARRTACMSNLKQLVTAMHLYRDDYGEYPSPALKRMGITETAPSLLRNYTRSSELWRCAEDQRPTAGWDGLPGDTTVSYGYNYVQLRSSGVPPIDPSRIVALYDAELSLGSTPSGGGLAPTYRHPLDKVDLGWGVSLQEKDATAAFLDGRVGRVRPGDLHIKARP